MPRPVRSDLVEWRVTGAMAMGVVIPAKLDEPPSIPSVGSFPPWGRCHELGYRGIPDHLHLEKWGHGPPPEGTPS